jgi:hypothetical protein
MIRSEFLYELSENVSIIGREWDVSNRLFLVFTSVQFSINQITLYFEKMLERYLIQNLLAGRFFVHLSVLKFLHFLIDKFINIGQNTWAHNHIIIPEEIKKWKKFVIWIRNQDNLFWLSLFIRFVHSNSNSNWILMTICFKKFTKTPDPAPRWVILTPNTELFPLIFFLLFVLLLTFIPFFWRKRSKSIN